MYECWGKCTCKRKDGKLKVTLEFYIKELLYDIANMAWVEGDLMDGVDYNHIKHLVQDVVEDGNRDRVMRIVDLAHAEANEMLYPWSREEITDTPLKLNDEPKAEDVLAINLNVPINMSQGTINLILKLVHEWIVCSVLQDWLSITYPESSAVWAAKIEELKEAIRNAKNRSNWITRRKMFPSW